MNSNGELWGWGNQGTTDCSAFGLDPGSGDNEIFWTPVRCFPGMTFKDFAHDYYHTMMIGTDDKLYTAGINYDYTLGASVALDSVQKTPILNPTLTDDVKLIYVELFCHVAVTTDNKVYIWGWDWWDSWGTPVWNFEYQVPTEVTGLPVGANVIQAQAYYQGVVVLLDDGTVYAAGHGEQFMDQETAYPNGTQTFQQITSISDKFVVKIQTTGVGESGLVVLDNEGNIWGWNDSMEYYQGNYYDGTYVPITDHNTPVLVLAKYEGEHEWVDVIINTHQSAVMALDSDGYVWAMGYQGYGPYLANNTSYSYSPSKDDPNVTEYITSRWSLEKAYEGVDSNRDGAFINPGIGS
jgi:alpha-tubulin suppressor-like RCC1 family protein